MLETACRQCGSETIQFLQEIKNEPDMLNSRSAEDKLQQILQCAQVRCSPYTIIDIPKWQLGVSLLFL